LSKQQKYLTLKIKKNAILLQSMLDGNE